MSDTTLNRFLAQGTNAERLAFVPDPATPASGPDPGYIWWETDTGDTYAWDIVGAAWVLLVASSPGTVTTVSVASANGFAGSVFNPTTTPAITISTTVTGILVGNGTAVAAAVAGDFPTLNQNTTGSAATLTTPRAIYGSNFDGSAAITGPVGPTFGGTGIATYATGDLLYASASNVLSKLAAGTDTHVLTLAGGVPTWAAPSGGGTPGGSTTELQYNNAGAFGGISGATYSGGVLTLPNLTVTAASGTTDLAIAAISAQASLLSFRGASSTVSYMGSPGAADQIITGSTVNDFCFFNNGFRMMFCTAVGAGAAGLILAASNAGISWSTGTVPFVAPVSISGTSGNVPLTISAIATACQIISNGPTGFTSLTQHQINGTGQGYWGVAGATDSYITGNATNDSFIRCQAANFNVSTNSGSAIGFKVVSGNGGIMTSAPSGGTAAAWKLGTVASVSPTSPDRTIEVDIAGTIYYLHAKTTNN